MTRQPSLPGHTATVRGFVAGAVRGLRVGLARLAAGAACVLVGSAVLADDPPKDDEGARKRLEFLTRKVNEFVLVTEKEPDKPLVREKEPVLRFTNPARGLSTDGAIFVW